MGEIAVLRTAAEVQEFVPEWKRLLESTPPATPFQHPDWLLPWWAHFGSGELHIIVFRDGEQPAGVLPCFLHDWSGCRQLTLVGTGISDYLDPLFREQHQPWILKALCAHLSEWPDWEICDWQDLSADTPLRGLGPMVEDTPCSRIELAGSYDAFLAARPRGLRRNLRRYRQKAEEQGRLRFEADERAQPELLSALFELHYARWSKSGQPGTISANHAAKFLREASGRMSCSNMLTVFTLFFNDCAAAILLAFHLDKTLFGYLSAFDPQYREFGLGTELLAEALRYAHEHGYRCWNFLRGTEPYKGSWGAQSIPKRRLILRR